MNTNPQPQNTLGIALLPPATQSDVNQDDPQDAEIVKANPPEDNGLNDLMRTVESSELLPYAQSSIMWWFMILMTTNFMFQFFPDISSKFDCYVWFIMVIPVSCLAIYLHKCSDVRILANIVLTLKATVIVPSFIYIRGAIKSLGSGKFPDASGVGIFIYLIVFGTALLYIWGIYDNIKEIPRVREFQKAKRN